MRLKVHVPIDTSARESILILERVAAEHNLGLRREAGVVMDYQVEMVAPAPVAADADGVDVTATHFEVSCLVYSKGADE